MDMKEMTYSKYRTKEVLYEGEYKGHKFVILSLGNHPTAYVEDKIGAVDYDDIRLDDVEVHGGFYLLRRGTLEQGKRRNTVVGLGLCSCM